MVSARFPSYRTGLKWTAVTPNLSTMGRFAEWFQGCGGSEGFFVYGYPDALNVWHTADVYGFHLRNWCFDYLGYQ